MDVPVDGRSTYPLHPRVMSLVNPWFAVAVAAARLGIEAQTVVALRLMRLAAFGSSSRAEAALMVREKLSALVEVQAAAATGVASGRLGSVVAHRVLRVFSKRVRANRRRLSSPRH
jgi:hypothetical protein